MDNQQAIEKLISGLKEHGIKEHQIEVEDEMITFHVKKITYFLYVEDFENVHFGVQEIEDAEYSQDFLNCLSEYGDVEFLEQFLSQIKEGNYDGYRKAWLDLQKLEEKYADQISMDFEQIVSEKYGLH
jgi:hypothetical protein